MPERTALDRALKAVCIATTDNRDEWAPDARPAAAVPGWRLASSGAEATRQIHRTWFAEPGGSEHLRRAPISTREVVEYDLSWTEDGVPRGAHHLDLMENGMLADMVLCNGPRPVGLFTETEALDA